MNIRVSVVARLTAALMVALIVSAEIHAQARDVTRPWIAVAVPETLEDDTRSQALALVIADNLELTLRLIGRYVVRPRPTTRTQINDAAAAATLADGEQLDYVVFGAVSARNDGATIISLMVYEREAARVTLEREAVAVSLFDTFYVADELAAELLGAFSGQRIAYGRIDLVNTADPGGEYLVILDGTVVGRTLSEIERVLVGNRLVEIEVLEGLSAGERVLAHTILMSENGREEISFAVAQPGIVETEREELPVVVPQTAEPPAEDAVAQELPAEASPRQRWSRQTVADPGRRPIVSIIPGFTQWNYPQPDLDGSGFSGTVGVNFSIDVDYPSRWIVGGTIRLSTSEFQDSYESTEAGLQALVNNEYSIEFEAANALSLHLGVRLLEWGREERRRDFAVLATLGYSTEFYTFGLPGGAWIDAAFGNDGEWMSQDYATAGGRIAFRAHRRRFTLRAGVDLQYNWPVGQRTASREIYLWDSEANEPGYTPTGLLFPVDYDAHWSLGWDVGIGFSMGGRPRR